MSFKVENLRVDNLGEIPLPCKKCVYWEFPGEFEKMRLAEPEKALESAAKKRAWFVKTLNSFGSCGKIVYVDGAGVGYAQYAPSDFFAQIESYKSNCVGKASEGTVFLSCLYIMDGAYRGKGIGKALLESITAELKPRGFNAIETFARKDSSNNPSGPLGFYLKNGFKVKDTVNLEYLLVRLEL